MNLTTPQKIVQILLFEGSSLKFSEIGNTLGIERTEVKENVDEVRNLLSILGLKLISNENSMEISLGDEINKLISKNKIEELKTELSESALQTLAVVLYKQKATKPEIDFVRGVDSVRSLKNLLTRGIIERVEEKSKKYYIPTTETLRYLGLETTTEVEDFETISVKLDSLIKGE